ncbi:FMN-binding negative transcriptional regulator [Raineyella sp. LH-20]|uniref:FMN-binding negative transcriptional regulator n=1 Tax=Raineyella sp. LH-20 TaxID=3081204 RepID=UPI002955DA4B|nr:FMN-binding negative transcriptional regulator [Raineyella sp. LH-20]WOP17336.1 FMN-binding negative transcriptional regulator [Raineyella sp. LH-20]
MYIPQHFAMSDDEIRTLLAAVDAADLVTRHGEELEATYLPFVHDPTPAPYGRLIAHVQRNNPQVREPITGPGLVIAHGTEHYVSPVGLPSKAEHGKVVPTWDYVTVHVRGEVRLHDDLDWAREAVTVLTERHEPAAEWTVQDPPGDFVDRMLRAVIGVEFVITGWSGKAKMAQNKTPADLAVLIDRLRAAGDDEGAGYLERVSLPAATARAALVADVRSRGRG